MRKKINEQNRWTRPTLDSTFLDDLSCYSMASTWEACDGESHEKETHHSDHIQLNLQPVIGCTEDCDNLAVMPVVYKNTAPRQCSAAQLQQENSKMVLLSAYIGEIQRGVRYMFRSLVHMCIACLKRRLFNKQSKNPVCLTALYKLTPDLAQLLARR